MASVGGFGQHFIKLPWSENVHETAVELQSSCGAMIAFVDAVGQHFIFFPWAVNGLAPVGTP